MEKKSRLLRRTLQTNGIFSGISGIVFIVSSDPLAALIGLKPPSVLTGIGISLILFSITLFFNAARKVINLRDAFIAAILDTTWVLGSIFILLTDFPPFTITGKWITGVVADVVAVFAILQFYALWKMRRA